MELLRETMEAASVPYAAEVVVARPAVPGGPRAVSQRMSVRFSPPDLFRRELAGPDGGLRQLVVEDGHNEWIYDPARNKVWQGGPADPLFKRFGPDEEFDHAAENYTAVVAAGGRAAGRSCWKLELRSRADNVLARRLWVDRETRIVLRSESLRTDGTLAEVMRFTKLALGPQDAAAFRFSPPAGSALVERAAPDFMALDEAKAAAGVEPRLPAWLPPGYVFESLDIIPKGRRNVVHYRFSDGMKVLSLFQCPARVRLDMGGRDAERVKLSVGRGQRSHADEGNVLAWTSGGGRFVLVGPVSDAVLKRMAESVP
jgi:outer membrane lipoprotein-sorting protein